MASRGEGCRRVECASRGNSHSVAVDLVDAVDQLKLSSDGTGGELDRVGVGEEAGRVGLDLGEREVGGRVGCKSERESHPKSVVLR